MGLTRDFLAFGTDLGHLIYFSLHQWSNITSYRHMMGIKNIYMDLDGTKMIFIDDHNQGYVYTSVNNFIVFEICGGDINMDKRKCLSVCMSVA